MNTIEISGALLMFVSGEFPDELVTRDVSIVRRQHSLFWNPKAHNFLLEIEL